MALTYPPILPILLFLFFFTLNIYRPDGRTLRHFTMMTRTLTNGRSLTDGRTNAVFFIIVIPRRLNDTSYHAFSRIYPHKSYDEYSYRYSHHCIFRASDNDILPFPAYSGIPVPNPKYHVDYNQP